MRRNGRRVRHTRRGALWVATCTTLALAAAACGSGPGENSGSPTGNKTGSEKVTLRYITSNVQQPAWDVLVKGFHDENPNITVKVEYVPTAKIAQLTTTQIQAGNPPDLIYASPGSGGGSTGMPVATLAKAGELADLSGEKWVQGFPERFKDVGSYDGKVYSLVTGVSIAALVYDVADFKELGVQPPANLADLLAICKAARDHGTYASAIQGAVQAGNRTLMYGLAASEVYAKYPDWNKKRAAGEVTFANSPGWQKVFQDVVDMVKADCFYPGAASRTSEESNALVKQNKAVLSFTPTGAYSFAERARPGRESALVPMVGSTGADLLMLNPGGISVAKKSQHVDAAKKFVQYVSEHLDVYQENTGYTSPFAFKSGKMPDFASALQPFADAEKYEFAPGTVWPSAGPAQAAFKMMAGLFNGQSSVDDVLKAMDAAWDSST